MATEFGTHYWFNFEQLRISETMIEERLDEIDRNISARIENLQWTKVGLLYYLCARSYVGVMGR